MRKAVDLSFAGCGFLGMFHIGSLDAFRSFSKQVGIVRCAGASSGAVVACAAVAGVDSSWLRSVFQDLVSVCGQNKYGPWSRNFNVEVILKNVFQDLPADIHLTVSDKLFISLTSTKFKNVIVSKFDTKEDLRDALSCSCYIPIFSGQNIPKLRNVKFLDGGLTNQLPIFDSETIKISPFSGKYKHICPPDIFPANITVAGENMYLNKVNILRGVQAVSYLSDEKLSDYYHMGYELTKQYLDTIK